MRCRSCWSELVIAFDAVEYAEEGVVVAVVLALEGFLDLGLALREALEAGLAEVDVIAFGVGIGAAAQADVPRLAESAAGPAAITAEHVPALVLGHVDGQDVRAESFECDFVPLAEQKHGVLLVAELVSLLRGLLLDAGSASEVSALLPLEPVEGEVQRCFALPASGVLLQWHGDKGNFLDSDCRPVKLLVDYLNGVFVSLEHMGDNCSLL